MGLRKDLDETRRQAAADAAEARAAQGSRGDIAAQRAEARSFELALLKKTAERDDENTALKKTIAELQQQLRVWSKSETWSRARGGATPRDALMADRDRLRANADQQKNSADVLRLQLEDATRVDANACEQAERRRLQR